MTAAEVRLAVDWAAAEGWNPGLSDAPLLHAADPGGFLVATVAGEPVATISVVAYDAAFAFLGLYIVRPDRRGEGHGLALWSAGLERVGGGTVGLDGVLAQQANYRRSGFELRHRNIRFAGPADVGPDPHPAVREPAPGDFEALASFDAARFGRRRERFLAGWLTAEGHRARVATDEAGAIAGYGVVRRCRSGHKVAPLFARTPRVADRLFGALVATCRPGEAIILDAPEPNADALALARRHGLAPVFETARMYRGPAPALPLAEIFGITSFELG